MAGKRERTLAGHALEHARRRLPHAQQRGAARLRFQVDDHRSAAVVLLLAPAAEVPIGQAELPGQLLLRGLRDAARLAREAAPPGQLPAAHRVCEAAAAA